MKHLHLFLPGCCGFNRGQGTTVKICSNFRQPVCCLVSFHDKLYEEGHLCFFSFFFFGISIPLRMFHVELDVTTSRLLDVFPHFDPQSVPSAVVPTHFSPPRCSPFKILMLSVWTATCAHNPVKQSRKTPCLCVTESFALQSLLQWVRRVQTLDLIPFQGTINCNVISEPSAGMRVGYQERDTVTLVLSSLSRRVRSLSGHPRPSSVEALVYRGCPCRDPPVCPPMPRQGGIGDKEPNLLCWLEP